MQVEALQERILERSSEMSGCSCMTTCTTMQVVCDLHINRGCFVVLGKPEEKQSNS
jgi:hypothetical protein